jgi:hypothetical protein
MNNIQEKMLTLYYDKDKQHSVVMTYDESLSTIKAMFVEAIEKCDINIKLRPDSYIKIDTLLEKTLFEQYLEKHPEITEADIDTELFEKLEFLFIDTLKILDIDNKLSDEEKYVPKKYYDQHITMKEKLLDKKLIEPNLWNKLDDYCRLSLEDYPYDDPSYEYASYWVRFQQDFLYQFIKEIMFYWGNGLALPIELNPILPHVRLYHV